MRVDGSVGFYRLSQYACILPRFLDGVSAQSLCFGLLGESRKLIQIQMIKDLISLVSGPAYTLSIHSVPDV